MSKVSTSSRPSTQALATGDVQVHVSNLNKIFQTGRGDGVHVLKDINLDIRRGELLVLLGPSGCGKTTLLRCLVGLEQPTSGRIELGDETVVDAEASIYVQPNQRDVGMVFQHYALWPHMTIRSNVAYPLKARKRKDLLSSGRVEEVLDVVQCSHLADRFPPELSGGQQQRISLARALAPRPALLLLDEPLSNLDALLRVDLRAQLRHLHRTLGFTGVYVTHDQEEAIALATRVAVMNAGRIEQIGHPNEIYGFPATEYVADFLGFRNRFEMDVQGGSATVNGQQIPGLVSANLADGKYVLRARSTQQRLRHAEEGASASENLWLNGGRVVEVIPGVDTMEYMVLAGENEIFIDLTRGAEILRDDEVDVALDPRVLHCYGEDGRRVSGWSALDR